MSYPVETAIRASALRAATHIAPAILPPPFTKHDVTDLADHFVDWLSAEPDDEVEHE